MELTFEVALARLLERRRRKLRLLRRLLGVLLFPVDQNALAAVTRGPLVPTRPRCRRPRRGPAGDGAAHASTGAAGLRCRGGRLLFIFLQFTQRIELTHIQLVTQGGVDLVK